MNTGCLSWALSIKEDRYHDVMNEFESFQDKNPVRVLKADNFTYKDETGTLFSIDKILKGEDRLLHIFIADSDENKVARFFEDDDLQANYNSEIEGYINTVPYNHNEQKKESPNIIIDHGFQINFSHLYVCHGDSHHFIEVIYENNVIPGHLNIDYSERSRFKGALFKLGYVVTVPVDVVCLAIGIPIVAVGSIFN